MPRDDELDESELPDESDMDDDPDGTPTIDCPRCGQEIHADTDICPKCGDYVMRDEEALSQSHGWIWYFAIAILLVGMVIVLLRT